MVLRQSCREIKEIRERLRFVLNVWQLNNPPPYFSITVIKLFDGCTRIYVLGSLIESMFSPDKQEEEKIIVKLS